VGSVCSRDVSLTLICFPWYLAAILPLDVVHTLGNLFTNMSLEKVYVSFTHTIKAIEPFFSVLLSAMFLEEVSSFSDLCFFFWHLGHHHSLLNYNIDLSFWWLMWLSLRKASSSLLHTFNQPVWMFNRYIQSLLSLHSTSTHTSKLRLFSLNDFVQYLLTLSIIVNMNITM
jgi:hypothetical protein